MELTQDRLKELLKYDENTGNFISKKNGYIIGSNSNRKYLKTNIYTKTYDLHRLVFLYVKGYFPENDVDHINRNTRDNRWFNLREVSRVCNLRNRNIQKNNRTGISGIDYHKKTKKFRVRIGIGYKRIEIGYYKKFENSVKARWEAEKKYDYKKCNNSSASYIFLKDKGLLNE